MAVTMAGRLKPISPISVGRLGMDANMDTIPTTPLDKRFAHALRFWHAWRERLARPDQRRLYRKSLKWSQSRLLFPGPNGAPLGRAALHNALRRLSAVGERSRIQPVTPEKIRVAFLCGDPLKGGIHL